MIAASTAQYRFSALWRMTLSRNSTSITEPIGPVACLVPNPVEPVEPAIRIAFVRSRGRRALQRYLAVQARADERKRAWFRGPCATWRSEAAVHFGDRPRAAIPRARVASAVARASASRFVAPNFACLPRSARSKILNPTVYRNHA
ncbi:hypothetical protein [Burkholderia thailandensis]|uniref:hypothetical protein n=1 Tax=Burkholderia thailandensis TaxID=57975 RepID=UPI001C908E19|nr:hypothetical protein [Burkholderia thailandensis]